LYALSRRIPQIQSTVNTEISSINTHIDQALENLGDRRTAEANRNQQYAMTSMNNLALMLSEALDQLQKMMNKGKGGKGKPQSISQLTKMQQQLNKNMQKAREQMQQQGNQPAMGNQGKGEARQYERTAGPYGAAATTDKTAAGTDKS
jgi:predicted transcriptional regulator